MLKAETDELAVYLADNEYLNFHSEIISGICRKLFPEGVLSDREIICRAFYFVRESFPHSWDIKAP